MSERPDIMLESDSVEATRRIGARLGRVLAAGDVVALIGPLGAGKTAFAQGVADGAGVPDRRRVNSPTFVIINEYEGRPGAAPLKIYHIDAYRLRHGDDLLALGFEEMLERGAVLIEWADRVADALPVETLELRIEPLDADRRRLTGRAGGAGRLAAALSGGDA